MFMVCGDDYNINKLSFLSAGTQESGCNTDLPKASFLSPASSACLIFPVAGVLPPLLW